MGHNTLKNYYESRHIICVKRKMFSLTEWDEMYPFERDIELSLIKGDDAIAAEKARQEQLILEAKSGKRF